MSIAFDTQCLLCHLQRNLEVVKPLGTEQQAMEFARDLMQMYLDAPKDVGSPWFNPQTADLMLKHYGLPLDRMKREKEQSNAFVLERMDLIRQKVNSAADPVYAGLQFAVLGNYLDFSALQGQVSFEKLEDMLDKAFRLDLDKAVYENFCRELQQGKKLLYLTDNAGEIVLDRLFAEQLQKAYPHLEITFCVRGKPAFNDALREDADAAGITFPVIDNGTAIGGTAIDKLGAEAKAALDGADVIFAKGMGNVESMYGCGYNVYYAFLVKCDRLIQVFEKEKMTPMLLRERS